MDASQISDRHLRDVQAAASTSIMKMAMNVEGQAAQKLLDSMPSAEEMRAMELSVNPSVGMFIDESV